MLLALRHFKILERKSLITNVSEIMMDDSYEIVVKFGKRDTKKRVRTVMQKVLDIQLKTKPSIRETGESVFIRIDNRGFKNHSWREYSLLTNNLKKSDKLDSIFVKLALAQQGITPGEIKNINRQDNFPMPSSKDIKKHDLYFLAYHNINDEIKQIRGITGNGVLMEDPAYMQVYDYKVTYESDEVIYLRG